MLYVNCKVNISEWLKTLNNLCEYIQKIRSDEAFEQFIEEGKTLAGKVNVTPVFSVIQQKDFHSNRTSRKMSLL